MEARITDHYSQRGRLADRLLALGRDRKEGEGALRAADLSPFDQFHTRGRHGTAALLDLLAPRRGDLLLDVGCGIGGPARHIAEASGARVVGVDLTESYCRDAAAVTAAVELQERPTFVCADATRLPFPDGCFDAVVTQHAAMNIPDKPALYRAIAAALRPGGRFAMHDIVGGPAGEPVYPTPWASTAAASFLLPAAEIRALLAAAGLRELAWRDMTAEVGAATRRPEDGRSAPSGPGALLGPDFAVMSANLARNVAEGRVEVVMALFEKG